ncbi:hypothetical protein LR48_Vigan08g107400 [Vigna angularis]|uniref:PGG domain-containing protein n=1 Tax=Phaseolus angularis TaxID=3914 RepID=A0A0L9V5L1_PHAAN|nr:hypothetical protein LR48_Vigan08g107400 [Vigna angularis]
MLRLQRQQSPKRDLHLKDPNTFLVAATLIVTLTFTAFFSVPGGLYSSDDPNSKKRGKAVLAQDPGFWLFSIYTTVAMFSSTAACILMLVAQTFDSELARKATLFATLCVYISFSSLPIVFLSFLGLVIDNDSLQLVLVIISAVCSFLLIPICQFGFSLLLLNPTGGRALRSFIALLHYDNKPEDSSYQKAIKDNEKFV